MASRIISGIIAAGYLVAAYVAGGGELALRVGAFLLLPLACIWFSQAMGDYTGPNFFVRPAITRTTPGCFVALGGWVLLFLPAIVALTMYLSGNP